MNLSNFIYFNLLLIKLLQLNDLIRFYIQKFLKFSFEKNLRKKSLLYFGKIIYNFLILFILILRDFHKILSRPLQLTSLIYFLELRSLPNCSPNICAFSTAPKVFTNRIKELLCCSWFCYLHLRLIFCIWRVGW